MRKASQAHQMRNQFSRRAAGLFQDRRGGLPSRAADACVPEDSAAAPRGFSRHSSGVRWCDWTEGGVPRILHGPGETEPGSAGVQPGKGYPGRRCADGASGLLRLMPWEAVFPHYHRTPEPCLRKPRGAAASLFSFPAKTHLCIPWVNLLHVLVFAEAWWNHATRTARRAVRAGCSRGRGSSGPPDRSRRTRGWPSR